MQKSSRGGGAFLFSERDAMDDSYRDGLVVMLTGNPIGHFGEDSHRLEIQRPVATTYHLEVGYIAVGIDHKTAYHSALYAIFISIFRISAGFVDISHKSFITTRKLRFFIYEIIFKHLFEGDASIWRKAFADPTGLGFCHSGKEETGE